MNSIESILGMIRTEAFDAEPIEEFKKRSKDLPLLRYDLELVEMPDGRLEWVE